MRFMYIIDCVHELATHGWWESRSRPSLRVVNRLSQICCWGSRTVFRSEIHSQSSNPCDCDRDRWITGLLSPIKYVGWIRPVDHGGLWDCSWLNVVNAKFRCASRIFQEHVCTGYFRSVLSFASFFCKFSFPRCTTLVETNFHSALSLASFPSTLYTNTRKDSFWVDAKFLAFEYW